MPGRLEPKEPTRRDFLGLAGLWSAAIAVFWSLIGMLRLPKPRVSPETSSVVRVGTMVDYPPGSSRVLPEHKIRIISTEKGLAAISLICTHLGCIVNVNEKGFSCPCHGSKFDPDGNVTGGPAPRGLRWLLVSQAADGSLVVNRKKEVKPGQFFQA
ncbi:MAG: Rieske 2Fe-2S domain-containing protein [Planctomycetes bacterium]|nr:Rieske 2Fe-2S domain-containing protein [Planctomycetota bacterium]